MRAFGNFGIESGVGLYLNFEEVEGHSVLLGFNFFNLKLLFEGGIQASSVNVQFCKVRRRFKTWVSCTIPFTTAKHEKIGSLLQVSYVDLAYFLVIYESHSTVLYCLMMNEFTKSMAGMPACEN